MKESQSERNKLKISTSDSIGLYKDVSGPLRYFWVELGFVSDFRKPETGQTRHNGPKNTYRTVIRRNIAQWYLEKNIYCIRQNFA